MKKWPGPTFEFALTKMGDTLCIFAQDIDYLGSILRLTSFDMYDAVTVCGGLEAVSTDGIVRKSGFDEFVRMLVPGNDLSSRDKQFLSYALSKIFFSFTKEDGGGEPVCPLDELCCGMLILAKAIKAINYLSPFRQWARVRAHPSQKGNVEVFEIILDCAVRSDEQYNGERPWNGHWKNFAQCFC